MLKDLLMGNTNFVESVNSWQEAIRLGAQPLLQQGIVEETYVDAMIQNVLKNGNYVIILPQVAMPHARPEYGSNGIGITFLHLKSPVMFPGGEPVKILFTFSSASSDGHLEVIASLGELLIDELLYQKLLNIETEQALLDLIKE